MKKSARELRTVVHDDQQKGRPATSKAARRSAAYHQAAHAVIARQEHVRVAEISIRQEMPKGATPLTTAGRTVLRDDASGRYLDKIQKSARIAMAGRIAEQFARGRRAVMLRYNDADLCAIEKAVEVIFPADTYSAGTRKTWARLQWLVVHDLLQREWPAVEAIAQALLAREKLSEAEIHRIVTALQDVPARPPKSAAASA